MNITKKFVTELTEDAIGRSDGLSWDDAPLVHEVITHALEAAALKWASVERIVAVRAKTSDNHDPVVGYAIGADHDIEAYFEDGKQYGITLEPITPVAVPSGFAAHRTNIVNKRDKLQAEVDELNRRLKDKEIHKS
jgi:hypothetical protein